MSFVAFSCPSFHGLDWPRLVLIHFQILNKPHIQYKSYSLLAESFLLIVYISLVVVIDTLFLCHIFVIIITSEIVTNKNTSTFKGTVSYCDVPVRPVSDAELFLSEPNIELST